jgi:multiple inositol-polyphosphate phosphatase / 2,3-bisphosphoglycerate 3-phosphatase
LAWYLKSGSPWCAAFTPNHVNVLEYLEDLKYFYSAGPGNELNKNIMCSAVQDLLKNLQSESNPKAVAYFSHSVALQLFLTALGYAKNEKLKADNYNANKYRKYRTSILSPFASNLAVIKYE